MVELHCAAGYLVYFVGFSTCFPYLGGLPPELATPRLSAPRKHVPAGSVGHRRRAGRRLPARLARRLAADRPHAAAPLRPVSRAAGAAAHGRPRALRRLPEAPPVSRIRVVSPGMQTTVQDLGRFGWAHFGVSASGAADALALRAGNLLVGNAENAAGAGNDAGGRRVRVRIRRRDRAHRLGFRRRPAAVDRRRDPRRPDRALWRHEHRRALLPGRARRHRRSEGDGQRVGSHRDRRGRTAVAQGRHAAGRRCRGPQTATGGAPVPEYVRGGLLRVTAGPQADWFAGELLAAPYTVTEESNRMGLRLAVRPFRALPATCSPKAWRWARSRCRPTASPSSSSWNTRPPAAIPSRPT